MTAQQFLDDVITPALYTLGLDTIPARQLLLGTAIQESRLEFTRQLGGGPALGFFQMEPATHADIWNWLEHGSGREWMFHILELAPALDMPRAEDLVDHPKYAAAMARLLYLRAPGVIPSDLEGQAGYYKHWYNTPLGAATTEQYTDNWHALGAHEVDFGRPFGAPPVPAEPNPEPELPL